VLEPEPAVVEPDTAEPVVVFDVAVDVLDTTSPEAVSWLAPRADIIDTSLTVAPLIKISSAAEFIWNKDPNPCPD
tara:strand:- start:47 stop:271 length:225 start_codon:yes stop_codon:yes gene_type:complete